MPHVVSITYTPADADPRPPDRYARVARPRATLVAGHGIAGDAKGTTGRRQLNVMRAETVEELRAEGFRTGPGELGEQLVIAGLPEAALARGTRLRLGPSAVIEITLPRTPCGRFARVQGLPKSRAKGRVGAMARVVSGGEIGVGDAVTMDAPPAGSPDA